MHNTLGTSPVADQTDELQPGAWYGPVMCTMTSYHTLHCRGCKPGSANAAACAACGVSLYTAESDPCTMISPQCSLRLLHSWQQAGTGRDCMHAVNDLVMHCIHWSPKVSARSCLLPTMAVSSQWTQLSLTDT